MLICEIRREILHHSVSRVMTAIDKRNSFIGKVKRFFKPDNICDDVVKNDVTIINKIIVNLNNSHDDFMFISSEEIEVFLRWNGREASTSRQQPHRQKRYGQQNCRCIGRK